MSWSGRCAGGVLEGEDTITMRLLRSAVGETNFRASFSSGRLVGEPTLLTGVEPRVPQQQRAQERQAPEKPVSRRVTLEAFSLSCPSFPVIGPGMKLGERLPRVTREELTFEIPGQEHGCWSTSHALFATCQEIECPGKVLSQQRKSQCVEHFRAEATSKCGPDFFK